MTGGRTENLQLQIVIEELIKLLLPLWTFHGESDFSSFMLRNMCVWNKKINLEMTD